MIPRKVGTVLLWATLPFLAPCTQPLLIASITANVTPINDNEGNQSTTATVYFTEFRPSYANGALVLAFLSPDGDVMTLTLGGSTAKAYNIDASGKNSFTASITVRMGLSPQTVSMTGATGAMTLASIVLDAANQLKSASGTFNVTLAEGGSAWGDFNATTQ
ncbi:MAG: hypothetical protein V1495_08190 [Pseudomonadota bacterium]